MAPFAPEGHRRGDELANGAVTRTYTYGLQRIDEDQVIDGAWTTSFYGYDGGGNVRQLTNSAGAVTDSYEYDAFGSSFTVSGTTPNNYLYRGEQFDPDLGLYYLRARYYSPATGRFMSRDPLDARILDQRVLNPYLYAGSNPGNYIDPRGEEALFDYAIESNAAIPEAKVVRIYGCVAGAGFAAASLVLEDTLGWRDAIGMLGSTFGCVTISAPASSSHTLVNVLLKLVPAANYGFCGNSIYAIIHDLNELVEGRSSAAAAFVDSFGSLTGCVDTTLGTLIEHPLSVTSLDL